MKMRTLVDIRRLAGRTAAFWKAYSCEVEEFVFRAIPRIEYFLHQILSGVQAKAQRFLLGVPTGITLNVRPH